jgi:NADPH2:quinone reductase
MRALEVTSLDGPAAVRVAEMPVPEPGPGAALLRVVAAGVNFADVMESRGTYRGGRVPPYVAGLELVGEVVALGPAATGICPGDVVLSGGPGAFAEYVVVPPGFPLLPVPDGWTPTQAIGLLANWGSAHAALHAFGRLAPGETVLIHAAAGGVGQAAVRLAVHHGARVIALASGAEKAAVLEGLGVDEIIDPRVRDVGVEVRERTAGRGVDLVLDSVGGDLFRTNLALAVPHTGRVVVMGIAGGEATVSNAEILFAHPVHVIGYNAALLGATRPDLAQRVAADVLDLVARGVIVPAEPTAFDLADGPDVLAALERRRTIGKLALVP